MSKNRKYYVISPNVKQNNEEQQWIKFIAEKGYVCMGWDEDSGKASIFYDQLQKGDIVIIAGKSNANKKVIGFGFVNSNKIGNGQLDGMPSHCYFRKLEPFVTNKEILQKLRWDSNSAYGNSAQVPAEYALYPNKNSTDKKNIEILEEEIRRVIMETYIKEKINLLTASKNLILTGAPGTGKTFTAQKIAEEMIKGKTEKADAMTILSKAIADFTLDIQSRNEQNALLTNFQTRFPIEKLDILSLDDYCIGKGDSDTFCGWIEYRLKKLGLYSGFATKFKIYWKPEDNEYVKFGFAKELTNEDTIQQIRILIKELVKEKKYSNFSDKMSSGFALKILNSYYPEEYFPINSNNHLDNVLKLFNIPCDGNYLDKNKAIMDFYKKQIKDKDISALEFARILYDNFNIKNGELIDNDAKIITKGEFKLVQFHPAYTYEDFVRGIVAKSTDEKISYKVENKILGNFAQTAKDNPNKNYVLIIDEINRANLPSVLGELIYALEYRDKEINTMYELDGDSSLIIPKNLYIIGTMNTADRSVGQVDYAIRRRFAFEAVLPKNLTYELGDGFAQDLFETVSKLFVKEIKDNVDELEHSEYLSREFKPEDVWVGHSYFITNSEKTKEHRLNYEIKPLLREYLKDGILKESAKKIINSL